MGTKEKLKLQNKTLREINEAKEGAMKLQVQETDELRNENRELRTLLTRVYYAASKGLGTLKEHNPDIGLKLGKELHRTKIKYLNHEHRN